MRRTVKIGDREKVTRIGLGTNRLTNTAANRTFLQEAVEAGLSFIDTAHLYTDGQSETAIGAALGPFPDDLLVATKGGYHPGDGLDGLRSQLEQSFERLRTDTIDLYYLHRVDPDIPIEDSVGLIREYLDAGRIAHVGISAVTVEQVERARSVVPIAAVQNEYNLGERKYEAVVDHCEAEGIVFVPYYPLAGDRVTGLDEVAEHHDATSSQVQLAWLLKRSPVIAPIPGTLSLDHLKKNVAALELELTDEEFEQLGGA